MPCFNRDQFFPSTGYESIERFVAETRKSEIIPERRSVKTYKGDTMLIEKLTDQTWFCQILESEGGFNPSEPVSVGGKILCWDYTASLL